MSAADLGSGSGGWTIPLAKQLEDGIVYAVDILEEPLSVLKSKALSEKIFNIRTILADAEENIDLPQGSMDIILMTNLLFQVEDKKNVLELGKRFLRQGGKILVVDWDQNSSLGPKEGRVTTELVKDLASEIGLKLEEEFSAGSQHYGLIFEKP